MSSGTSLRAMLLPLALAQFICSFAGSNMNVMINDISDDLDTTVSGVQGWVWWRRRPEISGLSRSVSNLGSSFGTAIAGTILVSDLASGNQTYVVAMVVLAGFGLIGLITAMRLPASVDAAPRAAVPT